MPLDQRLNLVGSVGLTTFGLVVITWGRGRWPARGVGSFAVGVGAIGIGQYADGEMPEVSATPDYIAFRKMEVYKAAVEELIVGGITPKERRALDAVRAKLGIATADANAMERNIITTRPRTAWNSSMDQP